MRAYSADGVRCLRRRGAVDARHAWPGVLVLEGRPLEEDLKSEIDGAAALEQAHRVVQVDLV